jgi:hypothetical protein
MVLVLDGSHYVLLRVLVDVNNAHYWLSVIQPTLSRPPSFLFHSPLALAAVISRFYGGLRTLILNRSYGVRYDAILDSDTVYSTVVATVTIARDSYLQRLPPA